MVEFSESESGENRETWIRRRSDFDTQFSISPYGSINRYEYVELSNSNIWLIIEAWGVSIETILAYCHLSYIVDLCIVV